MKCGLRQAKAWSARIYALALAQGVLLGLENGLEQIIQHCFFADHNVCRHHHARHDGKRFVVVDDGVFLGADLYKIKMLAPFVFNGNSADRFKLAFNPAVNGEIIG